ncbi:hypothetical protein [Nonomuraea sp. NPDC049480]|uniref:hypothetical protein n=1 Tax=Nonomuraea sp. NPDC049480 TaxID=3364353 RepID=UPI0037A4DF9E
MAESNEVRHACTPPPHYPPLPWAQVECEESTQQHSTQQQRQDPPQKQKQKQEGRQQQHNESKVRVEVRTRHRGHKASRLRSVHGPAHVKWKQVATETTLPMADTPMTTLTAAGAGLLIVGAAGTGIVLRRRRSARAE